MPAFCFSTQFFGSNELSDARRAILPYLGQGFSLEPPKSHLILKLKLYVFSSGDTGTPVSKASSSTSKQPVGKIFKFFRYLVMSFELQNRPGARLPQTEFGTNWVADVQCLKSPIQMRSSLVNADFLMVITSFLSYALRM